MRDKIRLARNTETALSSQYTARSIRSPSVLACHYQNVSQGKGRQGDDVETQKSQETGFTGEEKREAKREQRVTSTREDEYSIDIFQRDPSTKLPLNKGVSAPSFYAYKIMICKGENK